MPAPQIQIDRPNFADYQRDFLYNDARYTITEATTKGGKTFSHIFWIFECAHADTEEKARAINPHLPIAKDGAEYWWLAPIYKQARIAFNRLKNKVRHVKSYSVNKSEMTITTPIGTVIRFMTARDPDNLYGEDVNAAVFDEHTRATKEAWYALRSTLTSTGGPCKFIGNFKGKANWGHQLSLKAKDDANYNYFRVTAYDAVKAGILSAEEVEQARKDLPTMVFKALYLAEGDIDQSRLIEVDAINDLLTNNGVGGKRYISADIAYHGSDKFVICVWDGWRVIHFESVNRSDGKEIVDKLKDLANLYNVRESHIVYDADGVGAFVGGFLKNSRAFHNGASPIKEEGKKQDYKNLKSQCYFYLAERINDGDMAIKCDVSDFWPEINEDLECIKNRTYGADGKLEVLRKKEIKEIIGRSPDYSDALMMRSVFDLKYTFKKPF